MYLYSDVILYSKLYDLTSKSRNHKHKTLKIRIPGNRSKVELPYSVSQILRHIKCPNANRVTRMKGGKRHGSERPRKNRAHRHCADSLAQRFDSWQFWSFYYWNRKSRLIPYVPPILSQLLDLISSAKINLFYPRFKSYDPYDMANQYSI